MEKRSIEFEAEKREAVCDVVEVNVGKEHGLETRVPDCLLPY